MISAPITCGCTMALAPRLSRCLSLRPYTCASPRSVYDIPCVIFPARYSLRDIHCTGPPSIPPLPRTAILSAWAIRHHRQFSLPCALGRFMHGRGGEAPLRGNRARGAVASMMMARLRLRNGSCPRIQPSMTFAIPLPIDPILDELRSALAAHASAVLVAPPGAGKTTRVPLALMEEGWLEGRRILVLEPRRIAARAAAQRLAHSLS